MPIENVLAQVYNKDIINQANGGIKNMQVLRGTKREVTLMLWNEQLEKAKKRLEESKAGEDLRGGSDSRPAHYWEN